MLCQVCLADPAESTLRYARMALGVPRTMLTLQRCNFPEHTARVRALAWSADASAIVSGSDDGDARIFNVAEARTHERPL